MQILFDSKFFLHIRTESGTSNETISPYSVRMRENTEQKNSEYGHFARSVLVIFFYQIVFTFLKNFCENV